MTGSAGVPEAGGQPFPAARAVSGGLVFGAIAPHGGCCIEGACAPDLEVSFAATRRAMEELGRRFDAAGVDVAIVVTPHNIHIEGALAVIVAGFVAGDLEGSLVPVSLRCPVDRELAIGILRALDADGVPALGVSFAGNSPAQAVMPMDWGTLVPLWFMGGRREPPVSVVVVSPARELSVETHARAGAAIARAAAGSGRRVALIASADHGHAHDAAGPYGYHPSSAVYDARVVEMVRAGDLDPLTALEPAFVESAKADSWWQMVVLHGALGPGWTGELLSYEVPTYFGMLCAAYAPGD